MKSEDLEKLSQEEFDKEIEATGPAKEGKGNTPVGPGADPKLLEKEVKPVKNPSPEEAERLKKEGLGIHKKEE